MSLNLSGLNLSAIKIPECATEPPMPNGANVRCLCRSCKRTAFYLRQIMVTGDHFIALNIIKTDGTQPEVGEEIVCGECGMPFGKRIQIDSEVRQFGEFGG